MYLDYDEYLDFGGTLDETTFTDFEIEAEMLINWYTFNRLSKFTKIPYKVKRLVYVLVRLLKEKADAMTLGNGSVNGDKPVSITQESNDGVSVSYNGMSADALFELCKTEAEDAIKRYLSGMMNEAGQYLLYRGLYPGE